MRTPGVSPLGLTAATVAIYGCVPETTHLPAFGLMTIGLAAVEVVTRQRCAPVVFSVAAALVLWSGLYGATGRDSAVVGTLFAFWPFAIVPIVVALTPRQRPLPEPLRWVVACIGACASVAVARTGALEPTVGPALVAVAVAAPASLIVALGVARLPTGRGDEGRSRTSK